MQDQLNADFSEIRNLLRELERTYNPAEENLHFSPLIRADTTLYDALLALATDGLATVRRHHDYFSCHALYAGGGVWYSLFLMISSAAVTSAVANTCQEIPGETIQALCEVLVDISEYSTVHRGDIVKRNYEALGNTLVSFYDDRLIDALRSRGKALSSVAAQQLVADTVSMACRQKGRDQ